MDLVVSQEIAIVVLISQGVAPCLQRFNKHKVFSKAWQIHFAFSVESLTITSMKKKGGFSESV